MKNKRIEVGDIIVSSGEDFGSLIYVVGSKYIEFNCKQSNNWFRSAYTVGLPINVMGKMVCIGNISDWGNYA